MKIAQITVVGIGKTKKWNTFCGSILQKVFILDEKPAIFLRNILNVINRDYACNASFRLTV